MWCFLKFLPGLEASRPRERTFWNHPGNLVGCDHRSITGKIGLLEWIQEVEFGPMFGFGLEEFALDVQILDFFQTDFFARFSPSSRIDRLHIMDKRSSLVNDWPGWVAQHARPTARPHVHFSEGPRMSLFSRAEQRAAACRVVANLDASRH